MNTPIQRFFDLSVLGLIASGYLAVVGSGYLDPPTALLVGAGLLLRGLMVAGIVRFEISNRTVTILTSLYIAFYPLDYWLLSKDFVRSTVHLVFFIATVKVLTSKTNRDYTYLKVIALLELLAACILSANLSFFAFLAIFLLFGVATLCSSEVRRSTEIVAEQQGGLVVRGRPRMLNWRLATLSGYLFAGILALTAGLFFLLPRTAQAAFRHLVPHHYHLPGFSNEVILGQIGEIKMQDTPVMHVRAEVPEMADRIQRLKWRGTALAQFDGKKWFNPSSNGEFLAVKQGQVNLASLEQRRRRGKRVSYEVHLKDFASDTLFIAGTPEFLRIASPIIIRSWFDTYRLASNTSGSVIYYVHTFLENENSEPLTPEPLTAFVREQYVRLPALDPRVPKLALEMAAGERTPEARARAIEKHLRTGYGYTLTLPSSEVPDPLAYFLFERKKGHCEYFASSMAVMLRTLDIPARVVTGFQSGIFNPISGWQLIRASDAHSWVEAYIPGRGWITYDPTPPDLNPQAMSLLSRFNLYVDAAEVFWQEWVLNYDLDRQIQLAARMEESSRNVGSNWSTNLLSRMNFGWEEVKGIAQRYWIAAGMLTVFLFLGFTQGRALLDLWRMRRHGRKVRRGEANRSDATLLYERMLRALHRRGIEKPGWLTPLEFSRVLPASEFSPIVIDLTQAYQDLRYGGNHAAAPRILELLEQLEK